MKKTSLVAFKKNDQVGCVEKPGGSFTVEPLGHSLSDGAKQPTRASKNVHQRLRSNLVALSFLVVDVYLGEGAGGGRLTIFIMDLIL